MALHRITKGLDLPITGEPEQRVMGSPRVTRVAVLADDYPGMKPRMAVREGDLVVRGQPLFEDRKSEGVRHTSPAAGKVVAINRGARRAYESLVIQLNDWEVAGNVRDADHARFQNFTGVDPSALTRHDIVALLVESGLWTAFRTRPFSKVPSPTTRPQAIFVNAMDTNPLAPDPDVVLGDSRMWFETGLDLLRRLTDGTTYLCVRRGSKIGPGDANVQVETFSGPHPSGTVGLHIHRLHPVSRDRIVWHIGYQDVVAVAKLFMTGRLDVNRVLSVGGPVVRRPRLVRSRIGASVDDLLEGEFTRVADAVRLVSGSVLSGRRAMGPRFGYMGRYHSQLSVLQEGRERELLGWLAPGTQRFSTIPLFASKLLGVRKFNFTTTTHGSPRAMVPIGMYERVMPLDVLPTFLLRALSVGDVGKAEELGALELDEEDLALCTFVCPGKTNYGLLLRKNLQTIEEEG